MTKIFDLMTDLAGPELKSGERALGAVRVHPRGHAKLMGAAAVGGLVGMAIAKKLNKNQPDALEAVGFPTARQMALGLTNKRILVWECSSWSGKPKKLLGAMPVEAVRGVDHAPATMGDHLTLQLADGGTIEFEAAKLDKAATFVAALQARIAS